MPTTRQQQTQQMVAQLRLLNPNFSGEVGTPERWLLDTVAQALTDSQIDLVGLENALNIETKFGANLTNFVNLFGFSRQQATQATGFVIFSRATASEFPVLVPAGTVLQANQVTTDGNVIQFSTASSVTIPVGHLASTLVPITALLPGSKGDVEAGTINNIVSREPFGIGAVTNPTATTGGRELEDDNSLKVRFKNTVFRNLAGTEDQFLALAVSTAFSTKANAVGPISQYQEYIEVPSTKDEEKFKYGPTSEKYPGIPSKLILTGSTSSKTVTLTTATTEIFVGDRLEIWPEAQGAARAYPVSGSGKVAKINSPTSIEMEGTAPSNIENAVIMVGANRSGNFGTEWTSTLSTIPYAKNIWTSKPAFVTNGHTGVANYFFREGVDFKFNYPGKFQGDTLRAYLDGEGNNPETGLGAFQPNVTFINVYEGTEQLQAVTKNQVVLLEYTYTSASSRNDLNRNIMNAVDVFVDGSNIEPGTVIFSVPASVSQIFVENEPNSIYYYENYRRDGEPNKRPLVGNVLTPLLDVPVTSLPEQLSLVVEENITNYYLGTHYWLVHDVSEYEGTIRARDGIEWSSTIPGDITGLGAAVQPLTTPPGPRDPALKDPLAYTGKIFKDIAAGTELEVENYTFDKNIIDLQAALENARQITTDVLAHKAHTRYFKLDVTAIYEPGANIPGVNNQIQTTLATYLSTRYFGAAIDLSDLLQQIHGVPGVKNIRWTNDIPNNEEFIRVYETDREGLPLLGASVDRLRAGTGSIKEIQELYITGQPREGFITLTYWNGTTEKEVAIDITKLKGTAASESYIVGQFSGQSIPVTVKEQKRPTAKVKNPIRSFEIEWETNGTQNLPGVSNGKKGEKFLSSPELVTFDSDFFLRDNELPALPEGMQIGDTVPGLIIRPRAQGTWQRAK